MKGRRVVLDHVGDREAAALLVDGRLDDLFIETGETVRVGAILRGICDRPLKGQGGVTVRLPEGHGYLRGAKGRKPGHPILVQVSGAVEPGKAVPVTDRLLFKSRYCIVTPGAPGLNLSRAIGDEAERARLRDVAEQASDGAQGLILRSAAAGAPDDEIAEDIAEMEALCAAVLGDAEGTEPEALTDGWGPHALAWREWEAGDVVTVPGGFEREGVLDELTRLRSARVEIGAGWMSVEATAALVAVDVNTGGDTSPAAALKANLAAARALPRELRLRGLGGQIVVDFAPMPKGQRRQLEQALNSAFRPDPIETSFAGWTTMGLFEIQRKRERNPLAAVLGAL